MQLHTLLRQFDPQFPLSGISNLEIGGVREDSRQVCRGDLFVARSGTKANGLDFINDANSRGAIAVVTDQKVPSCPLPQIVVADAARAASILANLYQGSPSLKMRTFAVTGTNGKTTTSYLMRHLLSIASQRCGLIGTIEVDDGRTKREASLTTPAATDIADMLANMRNKGCRAAVMEVSSHALSQARTCGVIFAGAAFTNLTGDHLDYHKTMENYAAAKASLFESLDAEAVAVVNAESKWSDRMIQDCPSRIIRFGFGKRADYRAKDVEVTAQGSRFMLHTPDGKAEVSMSLIGKHNIENALTAAALVDYAHTDDALENVLESLRPITRGKLRVMFGCGGDRDRTKRARMAKVAKKHADAIYVTSDNPRTENARAIVDEVMAGFGKMASKAVIVEPERRAAIERIIADAQAEDVVLLAGKGHENYQIVGTERHHFDDVEEAQRVLRGLAAAA